MGAWECFARKWLRFMKSPLSPGDSLAAPEEALLQEIERREKDLKEREDRLRREHDLFTRIAETSPAGIMVADSTGRITFANARAEQVLGLARSEITARTCNASAWHITGYDGNPIPNDALPFTRVMATGEAVYEARIAIRRGDGRRALLSVSAAPLRGESGKIDGVVVAVEDVTAWVSMGEALRRSEEHYRALFEGAGDAIFIWDPEWHLIAVNQAMCERLGYSREELLRMSPADIATPEYAALVPQRTEELKRQGRLVFETAHVRRDGGIIPVELSTSIIEYAGKPAVLAIARDITERKRAEEALRESETRYRTLVETQLEAVCRWLPDTTLTFVNKAYCELVGKKRDELIGTKWIELLTGNVRRIVTAHCQSLAANPRPLHVEYRLALPDGREIWMEWADCPLLDAQGRVVEFQSVGRDTTQRKRAEALLDRSHREMRALAARLAEVQETAQRRLARELHDEVGQTLTALGISLSFMRGQLPGATPEFVTARLDDSLELVEQTALRIRDVISDLRPAVLDDYGLLAALRWYAEHFSRRTGIVVEARGQEPEPRLGAEAETALFRIAQEALTNVAKHARASRATVAVIDQPEGVCLMISDNGVGLPARDGTSPPRSRGWGLITMQERAAGVGAEFSLKSEPGKGTHIIVGLKKEAESGEERKAM